MVTAAKTADQAHGSDQVESLDSIGKMGAALEVAPGSPGAPAAPGQAANDKADAVEIEAALALLRASAIPFAPEHVQDPLLQVWSDKQLEVIGAAIVEICKLHGWTTGQFFDRYGPYIKLAMALGIPALATIKLLKMPPPPKAADGQQQ